MIKTDAFLREGERGNSRFLGQILIIRKTVAVRRTLITSKRDVAIQMLERDSGSFDRASLYSLLTGNISQKKRGNPNSNRGFLGLVIELDWRKL